MRLLAPTLLTASVVTLVTLTACATTPPASPSTPGYPSALGTPTPSAPTVSLPVAAAFEEPEWGVQLPASSEGKTPVVTAERVIMLDGANVRALDPKGKEAWSAAWQGFTDAQRGAGSAGFPFLRLASRDVVAVVDGGKAQGSGLERDGYQTRVTLLRVSDGSLVKEVSIPGDESHLPHPGSVGLGFYLAGQSSRASAVMPDGSVREMPATDGQKVVGAVTIGPYALAITGESPDTPTGFSGSGFDSNSLAPSPSHTLARVQAGDGAGLAVGRFAIPYGAVAWRVFDASTGKVLGEPNCDPGASTVITASPNRTWGVIGPIRLDAAGNPSCIGDKGQKTVTLTAVTDEGRAFGSATQGGSDALFVDLQPNGEVKTSTLPKGAASPIGVMGGNIAIHWDSNDAIVTANKIKEA